MSRSLNVYVNFFLLCTLDIQTTVMTFSTSHSINCSSSLIFVLIAQYIWARRTDISVSKPSREYEKPQYARLSFAQTKPAAKKRWIKCETKNLKVARRMASWYRINAKVSLRQAIKISFLSNLIYFMYVLQTIARNVLIMYKRSATKHVCALSLIHGNQFGHWIHQKINRQ